MEWGLRCPPTMLHDRFIVEDGLDEVCTGRSDYLRRRARPSPGQLIQKSRIGQEIHRNWRVGSIAKTCETRCAGIYVRAFFFRLVEDRYKNYDRLSREVEAPLH
jgi:hypothetical protein